MRTGPIGLLTPEGFRIERVEIGAQQVSPVPQTTVPQTLLAPSPRWRGIRVPVVNGAHASSKFLYGQLGNNLSLFAQCAEAVRPDEKPDRVPADKSGTAVARTKLAYELLESWTTHPSLFAEGCPDEIALRTWVAEARRECTFLGRLNAGDHEIGKLLVSYPAAPDGS